jgi:hypothetical protein
MILARLEAALIGALIKESQNAVCDLGDRREILELEM